MDRRRSGARRWTDIQARLADITTASARPVLPRDSPWITLSDGRGLSVQPGDIVVVQRRDAT